MNTRLVLVGLFLLSGVVLMAAPPRLTDADWVDRQVAGHGSTWTMAAAGVPDPAAAPDWTDRMIAARGFGHGSGDWVDRMVADRSVELAQSSVARAEKKTAVAQAGIQGN